MNKCCAPALLAPAPLVDKDVVDDIALCRTKQIAYSLMPQHTGMQLHETVYKIMLFLQMYRMTTKRNDLSSIGKVAKDICL